MRLAVFGSAAGAGDDFDAKQSDVDLLVEFEPLTPVERADAYFGLLESLEQLLGVPIDLLEAGPIRNPYLKRSIEETRVVVYEAA
jgi:predicted nucleotidyltransferase